MAPGPTCTPSSQDNEGTINWHSPAEPVRHTHSQPCHSSTSPKMRAHPSTHQCWHHHGAAALLQASARRNLKAATVGPNVAGLAATALQAGLSWEESPAPLILVHLLSCSFLLWALLKSQCNEEPLLQPHSYSGSFTASPWGHYQRHLISPHLPSHFIKGPVTHQDLRKNRPPPLPSSTISPLVFCFVPDH